MDDAVGFYKNFIKEREGIPYNKEDMIKYKQLQKNSMDAREAYIEEVDRLEALHKKTSETL
jgi:hypothetical protein